ncbi:MAG: membrane protease YdiL (CAAX protease family) [Cocleimonas sp.]|jgi:membrane protease YdiL (CAAX protease family)
MDNSSSSIRTNQTDPYWGFWATVVLGILVFLVFSVVQAMGLFAYIYSVDPQVLSTIGVPDSTTSAEQLLNQYMFNGDAIAVAEIPAAIIGVVLILWFASMRKPLTIDQYLDLALPDIKTLLMFLGLMLLIMVAMESVNYLLQRPVPEFMIKVYANTQNLPLLWIAVSVAAPFFEEFLFRGFLLEGLSRSRLGVTGSIILTSAAWAVIHMQYGWFEIISIFFIGIVLCIAKIKTKSLYVPVAMHMLMNLAASIGMEFSQ